MKLMDREVTSGPTEVRRKPQKNRLRRQNGVSDVDPKAKSGCRASQDFGYAGQRVGDEGRGIE
jgi:hypothetical protein